MDTYERLVAAVRRLPYEHQVPLELRFGREVRTLPEIGAILRLSPHDTQVRLERALVALTAALAEGA